MPEKKEEVIEDIKEPEKKEEIVEEVKEPEKKEEKTLNNKPRISIKEKSEKKPIKLNIP